MDWTSELISGAISCLVSAAVGGGLTYLVTRFKRSIKREKAVEEGVKSLLRHALIEYHEKYTARGSCPVYAKDVARTGYEAYHELGGNGVVTKLYEDIMALPEETGESEMAARAEKEK